MDQNYYWTLKFQEKSPSSRILLNPFSVIPHARTLGRRGSLWGGGCALPVVVVGWGGLLYIWSNSSRARAAHVFFNVSLYLFISSNICAQLFPSFLSRVSRPPIPMGAFCFGRFADCACAWAIGHTGDCCRNFFIGVLSHFIYNENDLSFNISLECFLWCFMWIVRTCVYMCAHVCVCISSGDALVLRFWRMEMNLSLLSDWNIQQLHQPALVVAPRCCSRWSRSSAWTQGEAMVRLTFKH